MKSIHLAKVSIRNLPLYVDYCAITLLAVRWTGPVVTASVVMTAGSSTHKISFISGSCTSWSRPISDVVPCFWIQLLAKKKRIITYPNLTPTPLTDHTHTEKKMSSLSSPCVSACQHNSRLMVWYILHGASTKAPRRGDWTNPCDHGSPPQKPVNRNYNYRRRLLEDYWYQPTDLDDILHPRRHALERLPVGHVVYQDEPFRALEEARRQRVKPLLPGSVPDLITIIHIYSIQHVHPHTQARRHATGSDARMQRQKKTKTKKRKHGDKKKKRRKRKTKETCWFVLL